jgi:integrase
MKVDKVSANTYRVRKTYKGHRYDLYFDHIPDEREVTIILSERYQNDDFGSNKGCFESYCDKYIESRRGVCSPSTLGGYQKCKRCLSKEFKAMKLYDITQNDVQKEISRYSKGRAPKTVRNQHGFISAVLGEFRPSFNLTTKLPQGKAAERELPITREVEMILKASEGTPYHIGFQLAMLGLRRSEICGVTIDDIHGNFLRIDKARIYDEENHIMTRDNTKTEESTREIYLPDSLVKEIRQAGVIYDRTPPMLVKTLHKYQNMLGLPKFTLHDLRHYYASYAHYVGVPDVYIMKAGGWKTDYVMKRIYRDAMRDKNTEMQIKAMDGIFGNSDTVQ